MPQPTTATAAPASAPSFGDRVLQYFRDFQVLRETRAEYWGIQAVNLIDCVMYFGLLNIASVFLSENVGLSDENAGYVVTLFTAATTIFLFFSGTVTDWLGIRRSTHIAMLAQGALRAGVAVVGLVPSLPHRGWLATILLFLMAPFMAMIQTVFQSANKRFTTERSRSAGCGGHQAHQALEQRRLADAVAAEHGGDAPGGHFEVHALQDMTLTVIGMQVLDAQHHCAPPR